ncbi:MAG: uridine kinase [Gemmatimonadaceae bacterium]
MRSLVIGIAGGSGSGKSTVARKLAEAVRGASVACVDMDAYYRDLRHLSFEERRTINWDHPDSFDLDLFADQVTSLSHGDAVDKPVYDFVQHLRSDRTEHLEPARVVVVEGILLFVDARIRELCDIKVFVDADADIRLIRRIRRDTRARGRPLDDILDQYQTTVQPMHLQFVEPSKRYADVIVPRGGHNAVAVDMITARIHRRLHEAPSA